MDLSDESVVLKRTKRVLKWYLVYHLAFDVLFLASVFLEDFMDLGRDACFFERLQVICWEDVLVLVEMLIELPLFFAFFPYYLLLDRLMLF